ncbi:MAG: hypothetical protein JO030_01765 [Candidatus Eremiobacteraeota bacterium]|nr:hypothetical protein [Candidatus Eremiobacteraeota bacterium]
MPLYDYACTQCGQIYEVRHGFDESYETPCAACGAPVRRVFSAAPVLFKGSGFYVTDSRRTAKAASDTPKTDGTAKASEKKAEDTPKSSEITTSETAAKPSESAA